MPLNKLENFIKNTEGRILYVNPSDLDATDSIDNQGNSLVKPFKTVQRALLESARFSFLRGDNNDIVEKTTILLFPGQHVIDNRPGYAIKASGGSAIAVSPSGAEFPAGNVLSLTPSSNFDLTQDDNILYKFNSIYGGVVVPRGTSIVGLDLRKTKLRPKYVPNPTDPDVDSSAIFRITGACYFWQFSIFDGDETGFVYTDPVDFSANNQSIPTFSHHKLTCFEYADGVNKLSQFSDLTDLDMYYSKLSNAYNAQAGTTEIPAIDKYPASPYGFAKQRPEWEIVGAFATDPVNISAIYSGDASTPSAIVTVTTAVAHNLTSDTPIKIRGVNVDDYNISAKVQNVVNSTTFTYLLPYVRPNLPAGPSAGLSGSSATVTIETDTVSGASPYVFNCSLRSVWGMNGMHADGSKASGFRSMVVAQFTAISLQKDDRAFVKYNPVSRSYDGIGISKKTTTELSTGSSSTNINTVYHLDSNAIHRSGWQSSHIKISNDSFIQVVSVFAIGFHRHFDARSGSDGSITNSNSNFGEHSLSCDGFKYQAFDKDNKGYITSIVTPKALVSSEVDIDWVSIDVGLTTYVGISSHLYLYGFNNADITPPIITQGYRVGARSGGQLYVSTPSGTKQSSIYMLDNIIGPVGIADTVAQGTTSAEKKYVVDNVSSPSFMEIPLGHNLSLGEKIRVVSETGDLPENLTTNTVYYAITDDANATRTDGVTLTGNQIQLASSYTNANAETPVFITISGGTQLKILSRVSDKAAGEIGSPFQWDRSNSGWYVHTNTNSDIYTTLKNLGTSGIGSIRTEVSYVKRYEDSRSLDDKIYKVRVVIPKELANGRDPSEGFILQESSTTGVRTDGDFTLANTSGYNLLTGADYLYNRNPRFISTCTYDVVNNIVTVTAELPHNLNVDEQVIIKNVTSTTNTTGTINKGYNGTFKVLGIANDHIFTYSGTDVNGTTHDPGIFTNNTAVRNVSLPRFEKNDTTQNYYIYRKETISQYVNNVQDGVYYLYLLNSSNTVPTEFTDLKYSQKITDLYPQLDNDNVSDNPPAAVTFAKRSPLGDVDTNDLKRSITRETVDNFYVNFGVGVGITAITSTSTSATIGLSREHGLAGIVTYSSITAGANYLPTSGSKTYYNVKLLNGSQTGTWKGATAKLTVSGGAIVASSVDVISSGSGYSAGSLYFDSSVIGSGNGNARFTVATSGISTSIGNVIQTTGIGTATDGYFRITSVPSATTVSVAKTAGDPEISVGQYIINNGPAVLVTTYTGPTNGSISFDTSTAHGLVAGNKFRIIDSSNNNLGDYTVDQVTDYNTFTANISTLSGTPRYILKHALSANDAMADSSGENLAARSVSFFANETLTLAQTITNETSFSVSSIVGVGATVKRFPLGSYIQIDNEIMRITSSTLFGTGSNQISVIRGALGTLKEVHSSGSLIRKIKPIPFELRRPSILRASGHTFEYLGYGPGNYSTGLPQVQVKTLTEREDFLAQAQESNGGTVIYTGMNSSGDFFIGNTKYSASSGEQTTYDIPVPTVTGQDPNRLSVIYDEVTVKERLLVEGGNSGTILSQFNGPVTFNKEVKLNSRLTINDALKLNSTLEVTNTTNSSSTTNGSVKITGGVGIAKNLNVGGNLGFTSTTQSTSTTTGALIISGGVGIAKNLYAGGVLNIAGVSTFQSNVTFQNNAYFGDNNTIYLGDGSDLAIYHNGSNSYIDDQGTGSLIIKTNNLSIRNTADTEQLANFAQNGAATLYYNSSAKLATSNTGVTVTGDMTATLDVIAFASDERLKTNIQPLENALDKVLALSGFTYNFNEIGESLGFDTTTTYVGVSAQQVQAVLPEAVKPAPADPNYITVQYEKLVPLLIEAIKELKAEIDELKGGK